MRLVTPGDEADFETALLGLIDSPKTTARLGTRGLQWSASLPTWKERAAEVEWVYERALREGARPLNAPEHHCAKQPQ
jgi:hypothetical protein